jgi:hypothetical protein
MRHARDQLRDLEPIFHRSPAGSGREVFERMTAEDFWEVGASGRVYPRPVVLDVLERRYADLPDDPWQVRDFAARPLGGDTWLVTYELDQAGRLTRRATIWRSTVDGWVALYHQGTVMPGTSPGG